MKFASMSLYSGWSFLFRFHYSRLPLILQLALTRYALSLMTPPPLDSPTWAVCISAVLFLPSHDIVPRSPTEGAGGN